jgi:uncharacterized peroxidase-related enzyme
MVGFVSRSGLSFVAAGVLSSPARVYTAVAGRIKWTTTQARRKESAMPRLKPLDPSQATGETKQLYDGIQSNLGKVINIFQGLGNSSAALKAYLQMSGALKEGMLDAKLREQIALRVGQLNECDYCLAAHTKIGAGTGLGQEELLSARRGSGTDARSTAALQFVEKIVRGHGTVSDADVQAVRSAGFSDGEIAEIVANIALNVYTNYFNKVNGTEVDFPAVPPV